MSDLDLLFVITMGRVQEVAERKIGYVPLDEKLLALKPEMEEAILSAIGDVIWDDYYMGVAK